MRLKAEWAIDSEAMRTGIILLLKSNSWSKNIETKYVVPVKERL